MLAYQSYNVKSPLNGLAAQWAENNRAHIPIDTFDFASIAAKGEVTRSGEKTVAGTCANCGAQDSSSPLRVCMNGHVVCEACLVPCTCCGKSMCMLCELVKCHICEGSRMPELPCPVRDVRGRRV